MAAGRQADILAEVEVEHHKHQSMLVQVRGVLHLMQHLVQHPPHIMQHLMQHLVQHSPHLMQHPPHEILCATCMD